MNQHPKNKAINWFNEKGWVPFPFQLEAWDAVLNGKSGLVNAPTGSGKTYSLLLPLLCNPAIEPGKGIRLIWITPIRALGKEIEQSAIRAIARLNPSWSVGLRSGDTSMKARELQKRKPPDILITTPESLHLLLAQKGYADYFKNLQMIVADEWHELMGSKRGVMLELAFARILGLYPSIQLWGISATIGNMDDAIQVLKGNHKNPEDFQLIRALEIDKRVEIISVLPDTIEKLPWAGHLGIHLLEKVLQIIKGSKSTLIFTNTRSFAEIWYQKLLELAPELSGLLAMHHSSISFELRNWVEDHLQDGSLKAVVCTSSLDLGVDFRPVETVIQIGSPKGIARSLQRAGRSGHQPGAISKLFLVPTNSLELIEAAAIREAIRLKSVEARLPYIRSFDVLIQFLHTLAVSDGFKPEVVLEEIRKTFSFASISDEEWLWILSFITTGGDSLQAYDEFRKMVITDGLYKITSRLIAMRHRLSIGTIVGDSLINVKMQSGKFLGTIEEYFISRMNPGDVFWFAGRSLELIRIKDMDAIVRKSNKTKGIVTSWQGGRMPLSSELGAMIRMKLHQAAINELNDPELVFLKPLFDLQRTRSLLPDKHQFLIEYITTDEGHHLLFYPFEGRFVHEGMAALIGHRISRIKPITFSIAMNDYGFELLSDQEIPILEALEFDLLGTENLRTDILASVNSTELARRKFRDIAAISGLVFKGFPGKPVKDRHLQANSQLFFEVFHEYEAHNLLLQQAYEEVMDFQLEEARLRSALDRIHHQKIEVRYPEKPTPLSFPIMVDRLREKMTTERIEDRIRKMALEWSD